MKDTAFDDLDTLPLNRRWREQLYPAPIVVALLRRDLHKISHSENTSHYLLIRRKESPYDGQWALVGGKWDFGETLKDAIIREVKEETDLDTQFVAVRGLVSERVVTGQKEQQGAHFLIFICELTAGDGLAKEQEEGEVGWFTCEEIKNLHESESIIPSDYAMIRGFAGEKNKVPYVEAEMNAPVFGSNNDPILLKRFETIEGHLN